MLTSTALKLRLRYNDPVIVAADCSFAFWLVHRQANAPARSRFKASTSGRLCCSHSVRSLQLNSN